LKASIIIPIQVASKEFEIYFEHLGHCLAAAARQNIPHEIIVVDYVSRTDYAEKICFLGKKYKAKVVRDTRTDSIWSRGRSLNVGIRNSTGAFVLFVDSDCIIPPDYATIHVQNLVSNMFTFSKFYNTSPAIVKSGDYFALLAQKNKLLPPLSDCTSHQGFSRATLAAHGLFDEVYSGWGAEDNDLYLRMRRAGVRPLEVNTMPIHLYHPTWQELMKIAGRDKEQRTTLEQNRSRFFNYKKTGKK
jgi:glycosyltransferase involved in cell wall biosynthesis